MKRQRAGFTIVETLIVLAVSGVLFISVAALISGQINRYRTRDAVFNLESSVRDVLNDVSTGYYPEVGTNYNCDGTAGTTDRGKNTSCLIAGKKIEFKPNGIVVTPVVAPSSLTTIPTISQLTPINKLSETKNYEWGIYPKGVTASGPFPTFYVLSKTYGTAYASGVSGGQSVGIYNSSLSALSGTGSKICFVNGDGDSSITLGKDGGLTVNALTKDSSC